MLRRSSSTNWAGACRHLAIAWVLLALTLHGAVLFGGSADCIHAPSSDRHGLEVVSKLCFDEYSAHLLNVREQLTQTSAGDDHRAFLLFGPTGQLEDCQPSVVTEAMTVDIYVLAWASQKADYNVRFSGPAAISRPNTLRTPCQVLLGPEADASSSKKRRESFSLLKWTRGPFGPGSLQVTVRSPTSRSSSSPHELEHTIAVLSTYRSGVRLGLLASDLQQQKFTLESGLLRKEFDSNPTNLAAIFVWYHDRKGLPQDCLPRSWLNRLNPMIGIPFDRLFNRWYAGLNFKVATGFDLNVGLQLENITELASISPLAESAGVLRVRTSDNWRTEPFVGVSIDAEALYRRVAGWFSDR